MIRKTLKLHVSPRELASDALILGGLGAAGYLLWTLDPRFALGFGSACAVAYGFALGRNGP